MSISSKIEWTEATWNPTTGCTKVSPGCKHCYAETMARRLMAMGAPGYQNGFEVTLHPNRLHEPMHRFKPTVYFVNSMSDLFHESVDVEFVDRIINIIAQSPRHTYQLLTKRADRMLAYFESRTVPPNLWLGVSVEDRQYGLPRIAPLLRITDARVHFLSIEPLLEDLGDIDLSGISQVIVGGESGSRARPMNVRWVEQIHDQCIAFGISFFFKQWGAWGPDGIRRSKKANGRIFRGQEWNEMPVSRICNVID